MNAILALRAWYWEVVVYYAVAHPDMLCSPERWREFVSALLSWIDETPRVPIKDL